MRFNYQPPVSKVLAYGVIKPRKQPGPQHWPNYVSELGLSSAHVPELIRLALDREWLIHTFGDADAAMTLLRCESTKFEEMISAF